MFQQLYDFHVAVINGKKDRSDSFGVLLFNPIFNFELERGIVQFPVDFFKIFNGMFKKSKFVEIAKNMD